MFKININNNRIYSQLKNKLITRVKPHVELIASIVSGLMIVMAWVFQDQLTSTAWITVNSLAYIIGGFAKAKEGITDTWQNRTLNVELLMIIAAIGAATIGYWTEGAILIFIFSLSGAMETYTMQKSEKDLSALMQLQPDTATRIVNGEEEVVSVDKLGIGDRISIKAGEKIAADGQIKEGYSTIDESALTGESIPVTKTVSDTVFTGTINTNGALIVEVTTQASESFVQKIMQLVRDAQNDKSPTQRFIEKFENIYVKSVLIFVALMMFIPHYALGWSWTDTIYRAMILLVVASPCALVASISPATLSAISNGARHGILFKSGIHLENLERIKAVAFDKTGTLTIGKPTVTNFISKDSEATNMLLNVAKIIESKSSHPLAEAIVRYVNDEAETVQSLTITDIIEETGKGMRATIDDDVYTIGSHKLILEHEEADWYHTWRDQWTDQAKTLVYLAKNHQIVGLFALKDTIREDTLDAIKQFKQSGMHTVMLTGDTEGTAKAIAEESNIDDYRAECMPNDKVEALKALQSTYKHVLMIGDGINDAPALATADIGVAMGAGTDVALETADIVLIKNKLEKMIHAHNLSRKMNRIIKQNIVFSVSVIVLLIITNFLQIINLPLGVIGHEGSTILVILNGLRMLK
nr:heavy metal translocating P-type ATPase [Pelagirhabdus alkalitolerans]